MSYLLDANVFISASRLHHGLDFCPAFWDSLIHEGHVRTVFSIDAYFGQRDRVFRRNVTGGHG